MRVLDVVGSDCCVRSAAAVRRASGCRAFSIGVVRCRLIRSASGGGVASSIGGKFFDVAAERWVGRDQLGRFSQFEIG